MTSSSPPKKISMRPRSPMALLKQTVTCMRIRRWPYESSNVRCHYERLTESKSSLSTRRMGVFGIR